MNLNRLSLLLVVLLSPILANASPNIEHWQTTKGASVYFVEAPELPMVDIKIAFDAGSARDGDNPGISLFTNSMLEEGAGDLSVEQIATGFDDLGAQLSSAAGMDMATISLRSLTQQDLLEPALKLFSTVVGRATFPNGAVERVREQMLVSLTHQQQKPGTIASKAFYKSLYGNHPYASPESGTEASVKAITQVDLLNFYRKYYVSRNALVVIVGAVNRQRAEQIAEQVTQHLPQGGKASKLPVPGDLPAQEQRIEHDSSQTHILLGQLGYRRGDSDKFALYLGNYILGGGGFVSRLTEEVREKRGLSYSVYSYFNPMRETGTFVLGLQTKNEQADESLKVLRETLQRFVEEGPTTKELIAAKSNITGGFPLKIDSNSDLMSYVLVIGFYGFPLDYLESFSKKINAVSVEQIREAYQKHIEPDQMHLVMVGGK
ncbi:MAG: insulinase family protein [Gammaproteobacteria bacterium]|nr:insulinase family protein [Gammaproteobacteria bacterium]